MLWKEAVLLCVLYTALRAFGSGDKPKKARQLVLEHAQVTFVDGVHISNFSLSTRRYSRRDRNYYISVRVQTITDFDNKFGIYFDFYELLSNVYKPSFVKLHFDNYCDFLEKDTFLGTTIITAYLKSTPKEKRLKNISCPVPPGEFIYENMTVPSAPVFEHFPFTNGRVYCNVTYQKRDLVLSFNMDMTLK